MAGHQSRIPAGACFRPAASRLLDQVREVMRHYHYPLASERTYVQWVVKFVRFHGTRHPRELGKRHKVCNAEMDDFTPQEAMSRFDQRFLSSFLLKPHNVM